MTSWLRVRRLEERERELFVLLPLIVLVVSIEKKILILKHPDVFSPQHFPTKHSDICGNSSPQWLMCEAIFMCWCKSDTKWGRPLPGDASPLINGTFHIVLTGLSIGWTFCSCKPLTFLKSLLYHEEGNLQSSEIAPLPLLLPLHVTSVRPLKAISELDPEHARADKHRFQSERVVMCQCKCRRRRLIIRLHSAHLPR